MGFPTRRQGTPTSSGGSSVTTLTVTLGSAPLLGSVLVGCCYTGAGTSLVCKDSNSNFFTEITNVGGNHCFYMIAPSNATASITLSWTTAVSFSQFQVDEFTVSGGTGTLDAAATVTVGNVATGAAGAINQPSITPTFGAGELFYAYCGPNQSVSTPTTGSTQGLWTGGANTIASGGNAGEYILNSPSSSTAVNMTDSVASDNYSALAVAFYIPVVLIPPSLDYVPGSGEVSRPGWKAIAW